MPVTSTRRYSTTTGSNSYYSPSTSIGSYRSTGSSGLGTTNSTYNSSDRFVSFRSSSSYRNDTTPTTTTTTNNTSRYGVSKYIPRSSVDKELLPPSGQTNCNNTSNNNRFVRSESRTRDKSLDRERFNYLRSDSVNALKSLSSSSSFARTVATSGVDFYEKYSPAHYIPKCELSRSRSLSEASKLNIKESPTTASNSSSSSSSYSTSATAGGASAALLASPTASIKVKLCEKNLNNNLLVGVNTKTTNNQAFGLKNKILSKKLKTGVACAAASNFATITLSNAKRTDVATGSSSSKMINNNSKISYDFKNRTGLGPRIDSNFLLSECQLAKSQVHQNGNVGKDEQSTRRETELEEITKKVLKKNATNCLTQNDDIKFIDSSENDINLVTMTTTASTTTGTVLPISKLNSINNCKKESVDDETNVSFRFSFFLLFCFKNAFLFFLVIVPCFCSIFFLFTY